jgi:hypothetical protein
MVCAPDEPGRHAVCKGAAALRPQHTARHPYTRGDAQALCGPSEQKWRTSDDRV